MKASRQRERKIFFVTSIVLASVCAFFALMDIFMFVAVDDHLGLTSFIYNIHKGLIGGLAAVIVIEFLLEICFGIFIYVAAKKYFITSEKFGVYKSLKTYSAGGLLALVLAVSSLESKGGIIIFALAFSVMVLECALLVILAVKYKKLDKEIIEFDKANRKTEIKAPDKDAMVTPEEFVAPEEPEEESVPEEPPVEPAEEVIEEPAPEPATEFVETIEAEPEEQPEEPFVFEDEYETDATYEEPEQQSEEYVEEYAEVPEFEEQPEEIIEEPEENYEEYVEPEEPAEEIVEELVEEQIEEPVEEYVEEIVEEPAPEPVEEVAEEPAPEPEPEPVIEEYVSSELFEDKTPEVKEEKKEEVVVSDVAEADEDEDEEDESEEEEETESVAEAEPVSKPEPVPVIEEQPDEEYKPKIYGGDEEQDESDFERTMDESRIGHVSENEDELVMPKKNRPFDLRLRTANEKLKKRYSAVRNELESYGMSSRNSRSRENYRYKNNLYARFTFKGKTLCLHLRLDPTKYDSAVYGFTKLEKAGYEDIPVLMPIKSAKNVKAAIELIGLMASEAGLEKSAKHQDTDYVSVYENTYSDFEAKGYGYMVEHTVTAEMVDKYRPVFAERIAIRIPIETEEPKRYIKVSLRMTDINENFSDGAIVDLAALKEKGLAPKNANYLAISANKSLSKRFFVTANEISPRAVKMICLTGGQAYILYRKQSQTTTSDN